MALPNLNITQEAQIMEALYRSSASSAVPLVLMESLMIGVGCVCAPIASYMLWTKSATVPRTPSIATLWIFLAMIITHWALSLRQLESTLSGSSLGLSVPYADLWDAIIKADKDGDYTYTGNDLIGYSYIIWAEAWEYFFPLVAETVLFGFTSSLFVCMIYITFWKCRPQGRSCISLTVPIMAISTYTFSLVHWAVNIRSFTRLADTTLNIHTFDVDTYPYDLALMIILSINTVMSDSIVLWRMCAVWYQARPVLVLGAALLVTTLGLNITNIIANARIQLVDYNSRIVQNQNDTEIIPMYGGSYVALAAAFVSLASNLCATILVAIRVWLHRAQFSKYLQSSRNRRTLAERCMEIIVDSGLAYTSIWLLYCISFLQPITTQAVLGPKSRNAYPIVTAAGYLDAVMAQLTTIYPLIVFLLITLDKLHHSPGLKALHNPCPRGRGDSEAVTVTFAIDIERSIELPGADVPQNGQRKADVDEGERKENEWIEM